MTLRRTLLLLFAGAALHAQSTLTVTTLDFKTHGLAVVLRTPGGRTWLVDAGLRPKDGYWSAQEVIAPYLKSAGVTKLDGVLISHPHGDHYGGLPYLLERFPIAQLVDAGYEEIGGAELEEYREHRARYVAAGGRSVVVRQGAAVDLDPALETEVLWPPRPVRRSNPSAPDDALYNANSIVLRVRHGSNVLLLPGDFHGIAGLARQAGADKVKCDALLAPHHGLNSTSAMADATGAKIVVVASLPEYSNPTIRPWELTVKAFPRAQVLATWAHGHITVVSDGKTLTAATTRKP